MYILNKIFKYPIILYDNFDKVIAIFDDGIKFLADSNLSNQDLVKKYSDNKNIIIIKYNISSFTYTNIPNIIYSIYNNL